MSDFQGGTCDLTSKDMKLWKCHKLVRAEKIKEVLDFGNYIYRLDFEGGGFRHPSPDYMLKHRPVAGGYFVVYEGGYESFSPAKAFEEGYSRID